MSIQSKAPLRASQRKELQRQKLRRQARLRALVLLVIIGAAWIIDFAFFNNTTSNDSAYAFIIAKSVALGALLNWVAQTVFAWFIFRYSGAQARQNIVGSLYFGQIVKWVIVIAGFSLIFMTIKSLSAAAIVVGFMTMQIGQFLTLWKIR
ncbi:ATP synthase subunit I [Psychrobacter raelei]|uniref:ATP synthase subunit I n=1 Tax=Psychrobacter raelei TaxID=2565531 RepID=A0AAU6PVA9_9GAMM